MANPFLAEIRIFACNFAPVGWAMCNGQLIPISQMTALFSLLGTTYGGNGIQNFALPNLQGMAPLMPGQGPGLSQYVLGETGGETSVTLLESEIPSHSHTVQGNANPGISSTPTNGDWASAKANRRSANLYSNSAPNTSMSAQAIGPSGGGQPHNNMPPYLVLNFCIALQGIFPARP